MVDINHLVDAITAGIINEIVAVIPTLQNEMQIITDKHIEKMYAYPATPTAERTRRWEGGIGGYLEDVEYSVDGNGIKITMMSYIPLQHTRNKFGRGYGANAIAVVESGDEDFNQPFKRPVLANQKELDVLADRFFTEAVDRGISKALM